MDDWSRHQKITGSGDGCGLHGSVNVDELEVSSRVCDRRDNVFNLADSK